MRSRLAKAASDVLTGKTPDLALRSPQWPRVREAHLKTQPICQVCGLTFSLEVHHIVAFHIRPDLELEPTNLITLCESKLDGINCHLLVGHLGDYHDINPSVVDDASRLLTFFSKLPPRKGGK